MRTSVVSGDRIGRARSLWHTQSDGSVVLENQQDVTDIIDTNKRLFRSVNEKTPFGVRKHAMRRVASIPNVIYWAPEFQKILNDDKALRKWLNDPSNRCFRVFPGRV